MIKKIEDLVKEHAFFSELDSKYIDLIAGCGKNVHFKANEIVAKEGQKATSFYVIRSGRVAINTSVPGKGSIPLQTVGEGDILGWSWLFPPYLWTFEVKAIEEVSAIDLDGVCLRNKCETDPAMGFQLMKKFAQILTDRLQATRLQLLDVYGNK